MFLVLVLYFLLEEKWRPLPFWHLRYPFIPVGKHFCDHVLCLPQAAFLDCMQGSEELQGVFPPSQGPCNKHFATESLQDPCRKALPDLRVSSILPNSPLLQLKQRLQKDWGAFQVQAMQHRVSCAWRRKWQNKNTSHDLYLQPCALLVFTRKVVMKGARSVGGLQYCLLVPCSLKVLFMSLLALVCWSPFLFSSW